MDSQMFSSPQVSMEIPFSKHSPKGHTSENGWIHGKEMQMLYAKILFYFIVLWDLFFWLMHCISEKEVM